MVDAVNWKLVVAVGAAVGGAVFAARRKQKEQADAAPWAEATDPVARFGS